VGGVFKAGDVDSLLRAIATGFDVVITAKGGDNIELSLAQDAAPSVQ
jgi:ferric-dicitrate binding protein FerR (iron transport regulator)